ncbi:MAG: PSD1 and planctomycete cytochrome C domain-containing protein [Verrucomicrobiota bacterium]
MNSRSLAFLLTFFGVSSIFGEDGQQVEFVRDIKPLLSEHCIQCHGPEKREGGLRLDTKKWAMQGGDLGEAIIPGKPDESELIYRVETDDELDIMPPKGDPLSAEQVDLLKRWIQSGAIWPDGIDEADAGPVFWSFKPLTNPTPPNRTEEHAIDKFVRAKLEAEKLEFSPRADRDSLLRRLSLDLTGLPPSLQLQKKFRADESDEAYERMVDELLASPHFGEKWAMSWLDAARYADSDGYEKDNPRPHAWRWRDWVIDAINRDLPFDEFTVQQLAGDLLPGATELVQQATGFHRNTLTNREGGVDREEFRIKSIVDRTNTTFSVWMGLTVGCAQCHTHKYDPITQREYFQLFSFFNNSDEHDLKTEPSPKMMDEYRGKLAVFEKRLAELETQFEAAKPEIETRQRAWETELIQQLRNQWEPLDSITAREVGDNVLELSGKAGLEKVTGIRITPDGEFDDEGVVSHVELSTTDGRIWLDSATTQGQSVPSVLDPDSDEGWNLAKATSEQSLILTTGVPGEGGWLGQPLIGGAQDSAAHLLNVYYESPISGRGTVDKIRIYSQSPADRTFTVYLLRPEGANFKVIREQQFKAAAEHGEQEFALESTWDVQHGDLFAHWGNGGPTHVGGSKDVIYYPMAAKPKPGDSLEVAKLRTIASRRYAFQYEMKPAAPSEKQEFVKPSWSADGTDLVVRLRWSGHKPHAKLLVSVTKSEDPLGGSIAGLAPEIVEILKDAERTDEQKKQLFDHFVGLDEAGKRLKAELDKHQKSKPKEPVALVHVMKKSGPRKTHVHLRGNFMEKGTEVPSATPEFLPPMEIRGDSPDRLDLARWIIAPENPLTPRVAVNQIWAELFGQGLVRTADDFGTQGEEPSHPQLLDWLASEFQRFGWSRKKLIKLIVMSETYQQASQSRDELNERDPENRLLARQNRFRLSAELVRDQFLAASTLLNDQIGGPSYRPPLPVSVTKIQFVNKWTADSGDELLRRGLYIHLQRNLMLPMLTTFDRPEAILSCSKRERSNTPLQALTLLNHATFVQASQEMAKVVLQGEAADDSARANELFERVLSRPATGSEKKRVVELVEQVRKIYALESKDAADLIGPRFLQELEDDDLASAAAWVVASRTVLNLDEAITRE